VGRLQWCDNVDHGRDDCNRFGNHEFTLKFGDGGSKRSSTSTLSTRPSHVDPDEAKYVAVRVDEDEGDHRSSEREREGEGGAKLGMAGE